MTRLRNRRRSSHPGRAAVLAGTALAALGLAATPAPAVAPTYTVGVGGDTTAGTHPLSATSTGVVAYSVRNSAGTIVNFNCSTVRATGQVTSGTTVNPVATTGTTTWTGCTMPGGAQRIASAEWEWHADGVATPGDDLVSGRLRNVDLEIVSAANPVICSFVATGSLRATFDEATQQLQVRQIGYTGELAVSAVSGTGCLGQIQVGNALNLVLDWDLTSPDGAIDLG